MELHTIQTCSPGLNKTNGFKSLDSSFSFIIPLVTSSYSVQHKIHDRSWSRTSLQMSARQYSRMSRIASNLGGVIDAMWGKMMLQVGCSGVQSLSNTLHAVYMFFPYKSIVIVILFLGNCCQGIFVPAMLHYAYSNLILCFPNDHYFELPHGVWSCLFDVLQFFWLV